MSESLPEFSNPPLSEVALSVQFDPISQLRTAQIGVLWGEFREHFPSTEERPPIDAQFERFGSPVAAAPRFQLLETPPVARVWFVNVAGTELIQVQNDRFIHNWRKTGKGDAYPRYERLRETFKAELDVFRQTVSRENWGQVTPNQCEVTYVNHIFAGVGWSKHSEVGNVVTFMNHSSLTCGKNELEDATTALRFIIRDSTGKPTGRLHVNLQPSFSVAGGVPSFDLTITARIQPAGGSTDDILSCLDTGRIAVANAFASLTTSNMHEIWGRVDA